MARRRKCKTCGNSFEPKDPNDFYCSPLCRTAGCFVGGGGDTRKPISPEMRKAMEKKGITASSPKDEKPKRTAAKQAKFPRVHYMFTLPPEKRYEVSRHFSPEEAEYCRRLARKKLHDEWRNDDAIEAEEFSDNFKPADGEMMSGGRLGDSDDGTI